MELKCNDDGDQGICFMSNTHPSACDPVPLDIPLVSIHPLKKIMKRVGYCHGYGGPLCKIDYLSCFIDAEWLGFILG